MKKRGLYNKWNERIGSVEYDGKRYYNVCLYGQAMLNSLTFEEFWNLMDDLDLAIEVNALDLSEGAF